MIYFVCKNDRGGWVVYGTDGVKQYYGYTKKQAIAIYNETDKTIKVVKK